VVAKHVVPLPDSEEHVNHTVQILVAVEVKERAVVPTLVVLRDLPQQRFQANRCFLSASGHVPGVVNETVLHLSDAILLLHR